MKQEIVTISNAKKGLRVKRGMDWNWGNQDCNDLDEQQEGTIMDMDEYHSVLDNSDTVLVKWDHSHTTYFYRIGPGHHDLSTKYKS